MGFVCKAFGFVFSFSSVSVIQRRFKTPSLFFCNLFFFFSLGLLIPVNLLVDECFGSSFVTFILCIEELNSCFSLLLVFRFSFPNNLYQSGGCSCFLSWIVLVAVVDLDDYGDGGDCGGGCYYPEVCLFSSFFFIVQNFFLLSYCLFLFFSFFFFSNFNPFFMFRMNKKKKKGKQIKEK